MPRALIALLLLAGVAHADVAKAKAANARGYALHKNKQYKQAAVEYRAAIAEDSSYVLAHYNLACVASLLKDRELAIQELAWLMDRSTWDAGVRSAAAKSRTDRDLKWIRDQDYDAYRLTGTDIADDGAIDLAVTPELDAVGKPTTDAKLLAALAAAPGKHDTACSAAAFTVAFESATLVATLRDGVALFDAAGKLLGRAPLGCTAAQDRIASLVHARGLVNPSDQFDDALMASRLIVVQLVAGAQRTAVVFSAKKDGGPSLVRAFEGAIQHGNAKGALLQTPILGHLIYTPPGETQPRELRWTAGRFIAIP